MNYEEYKEYLMNEIENQGRNVHLTKYEKNNGTEKEALTIQMGNGAEPIIYLEELFESYNDGASVERQIESIMKIVEQDSEAVHLMGLELLNESWENIRSKIGVQVINYEWNEKKLEEIPHKRLLNLAIVCRVMFSGNSSSLVTNALLEKWKITKEELMDEAFSNLKNGKYTIKGLSQLVAMRIDEDPLPDEDELMYVMTNDAQVYGATGIARTDLLKEFADKIETDIYVIPSSIHEILLVPANGSVDLEYMKSVVKEVNQMDVKKEEWLSDDIYFFRRDCEALMVAA